MIYEDGAHFLRIEKCVHNVISWKFVNVAIFTLHEFPFSALVELEPGFETFSDEKNNEKWRHGIDFQCLSSSDFDTLYVSHIF